MTKRREKQGSKRHFPTIFLVASILLHLFVFVIYPHIDFSHQHSGLFDKKETIIEIDPALLDMIDQKQLEQIVQTEEVESAKESPDAKFLGKKTQVVEKETKAARVDIFRKGQPKSGQKLSLKQLAPKQDFKPLEPGDFAFKKPPKKQLKDAGERGGMQSANNDYLEDVEKGNRTLLNTREFIYYGYYHRIRQKLEQSWNSELRSVLLSYYRQGRKLTSESKYVTRLVVVLNKDGKITTIQVLDNSGAEELDDAAIEAFNRAGPFPNPPQGLVEKDGKIKIRWDFILQS